MRFAIVRAAFNEAITDALLLGARRAFADARIAKSRIDEITVPGAFELPVAALWLAKTKKYNAIVCLGCVIRGETPHFEYVASAAARGVASVALQTGVPVIFGVLTTHTLEQAWARAGHIGAGAPEHSTLGEQPGGNKGYEAAQTAVEMARLRRRV